MKRLLVIALVLLFACNVQAASNFPSSLDSYSTKASSDTIAEGHINDPQDAIEAIEAKVGTGASTPVDTTVLVGTGTGTSAWAASTPVVQMVNVMDGAVATGATVMPSDDSIPQITEGDEFMTLAITPVSSSNKLKIDVVAYVDSASGIICSALFQDTTTNAIAAGGAGLSFSNPYMSPIIFTHYMAAGTTSATTFKVRCGPSASTGTFNGDDGARKFGGVIASSITITEYSV